MNDMKQKSNKIEVMTLNFQSGVNTVSKDINIPFPVKKIKVLNITWRSTDSTFYDGTIDDKKSPEVQLTFPSLALRTSYGYLNCNLQDVQILGVLDASPVVFPIKYIYGTPVNIKGSYQFSLHEIDKTLNTNITDLYILLTLEFLQD